MDLGAGERIHRSSLIRHAEMLSGFLSHKTQSAGNALSQLYHCGRGVEALKIWLQEYFHEVAKRMQISAG